MGKQRSVSLFVMGAFFSMAVFAIGWSAVLNGRPPQPWQKLAERMPLNVEGWQGEDVPLGANETIMQAVSKLNYNDYVYRVYRKNGREVFVYAMFWRQGDISVREMSGHTPDGCWVANGATHCITPEVRPLDIGGSRLTAPAEVREFAFPPNGVRIQTAWWHIWGGDLVDRSFATKSIVPMLKEIWLWVVKRGGTHKDQLLVRIHSSLPIDEAAQAAPVVKFIKTIPEVLVARPVG
jgi:hypothetical protein